MVGGQPLYLVELVGGCRLAICPQRYDGGEMMAKQIAEIFEKGRASAERR